MGAGSIPLWGVARRRAREAAVRPLLPEAPVAPVRPHHPLRHDQGRSVRERRAVIRTASPTIVWEEQHQTKVVALNVSGRYVMLAAELLLGLVMLPFNTRHLGASEYGLWMLTASFVAYFPVLDLGYGAAMERFVAHHRAQRDGEAINEIASTLVLVFSLIGLAAFAVMVVIALNLGRMFDLPPAQARSGALVLLCVAAQFSVGLPFAIFGAIVNGFQRTYRNAVVGSTVAIAVAIVNVSVLASGGTLVQLVAAMMLARMAGYAAYRLNAYNV